VPAAAPVATVPVAVVFGEVVAPVAVVWLAVLAVSLVDVVGVVVVPEPVALVFARCR
jgi:hypothetical protein